MRPTLLLGLVLLAPVLSPVFSAGAQTATVELRFATLAPEGSPWMRVFRAWDQDIREGTQGAVGLRIYPGGSQGQEGDYIDKMQAGQLDGAALSSTGLSQIVRPVLVMSLPGVVPDYATLDRVRRRMARRFERRFTRSGYTLLGWGDAGRARLFSTRRIVRPSDLVSTRPWAPRNDLIFSEFLNVVGATPRRLGIGEVYPALQTGMVNTVPGSALAAQALQWQAHLRFYSETSTGVLVGATLMRSERLEALPEQHQQVVRTSARRASRILSRLIRRADERALRRMAGRLTAVPRDSRYDQEWMDAAIETRERLVGRVFSRSLYDAVVRAAAE